jgi:hypothetical protein
MFTHVISLFLALFLKGLIVNMISTGFGFQEIDFPLPPFIPCALIRGFASDANLNAVLREHFSLAAISAQLQPAACI